MRITRFIIAFILTASLIFCLVLNVSAGGEEVSDLYLPMLDVIYFRGGSPSIEEMFFADPNAGGNFNYFIPGTIMNDQLEYQVRSAALLGYPETDLSLWQQGYIYTFTYELRISTSAVPDPDFVTFQFGIATSDGLVIQDVYVLSDVIFTYDIAGSFTYFYVSSIVYVDENFKTGNISSSLDDTYVYLEFSLYESSSVNIGIRTADCKVIKAIGEDAYYQASIDALNDLNSSVSRVDSSVNQVNNSVNELNQSVEALPEATVNAEHEFIYNSMPDAEGDIDVIKGDILAILSVYDTDIQQLYYALNNQQARPVLYLPKVEIPFLNIHLWDSQFFYVDAYLNSMNSQIMEYINIVVIFIRIIAIAAFATIGLYRMSRIEWWY